MREVRGPIHEVTHLGHIELLTSKPTESFWFFHDVLGMQEKEGRKPHGKD